MRELFRHLVRDGTRAGHVRGLRDFLSYTSSIGVRRPLPSSPEVVLGYIAYSLMGRGFVLDASTVDIYLGGVRAWHEQAKFETGGAVANPVATTAVRSALRVALKNFKKKSDPTRPLELDEWLGMMERGFDLGTRVGRHRQLVVVLCALGPLRPVAAKHLCCTYTLHLDGSVSYAYDSTGVSVPSTSVVGYVEGMPAEYTNGVKIEYQLSTYDATSLSMGKLVFNVVDPSQSIGTFPFELTTVQPESVHSGHKISCTQHFGPYAERFQRYLLVKRASRVSVPGIKIPAHYYCL